MTEMTESFAHAQVVAADDSLLDRALDAAYSDRTHCLGRAAYGTWDAAQRKSPWGAAHERRFALLNRDALMATALRRDLTGSLDGLPLSICALGSISSEGNAAAARQLIARLVDEARAGGAEAALIFASAEAAAMLPEGFEPMPIDHVEVRVIESPRRGAPMTLVRSGEERDLPALVSMGAQRAARYRFHLTRDAPLIKHVIARMRMLAGLGASGDRQLEFLVAEEGATAAAYVVISRSGTAWTIDECGDRDPSGARVGAMLQSVIARESSENRPVITAWWPADLRPPQLAVTSTTAGSDAVFGRFLRPRDSRLRLATSDVLLWRSDCF